MYRLSGTVSVAHGNADSGAMNDLGKPGAGEPHARFDEGRLETEPRSRDRSACNEVRGQRRTNRPPRQSPTLPPPPFAAPLVPRCALSSGATPRMRGLFAHCDGAQSRNASRGSHR